MSFDQKNYPYSYPIDKDDPGFLSWFCPKLTMMYIKLIVLASLFLPFNRFTTIFCSLTAIVSLITLNKQQKSVLTLSQPLLLYVAITLSVLVTSALSLEKNISKEAIFCPLLFSFFISKECLPLDTFYNILHEPKKTATFSAVFAIGYIIGYIHLGTVMLGTTSRKFLGAVPYITGYLRKYVCEVLPQIPPLKEDWLHYLCHIGRIQKIKQFFEETQLAKKETVFREDRYGRLPVELAGNLETLSFLIQQGSEVETKNKHSGQNLLHIHAQKGNIEILNFLIQQRLYINEKDIKGRTPVDYAKNKCLEKFLLSKGAKKTYMNLTKILNFLGIPR